MAEYYVDPTQVSNGNGSVGSPWNSWANLITAIGAGGSLDFSNATEDYIINFLAGADSSSGLMNWGAGSATARTITFRATGANKHTGVRGTGYRLANTFFVIVENPAISLISISGLASAGFTVDSDTDSQQFYQDDCLSFDSAAHGFRYAGGTSRTRNCAAMSATQSGFSSVTNRSVASATIINCTSVANVVDGFANGSGGMTLINCYSGGNTGAAYSGTLTRTNCMHSSATVFAGSTASTAYNTTNFTSVTGGSQNVKLPSGSALIGAGVGPGSNVDVPSTDFEGDARSGAITDVGFDQRTTTGSSATATPTTGSVVVTGLAPTGNNFTNVRYQEVLINAAGSPVSNRTGLRLSVWYSGQCVGAPDLSYSDMTTGAAGTASYSIATGSLVYGQKGFGVITDGGASLSSYTCGLLTFTYS